MQNNNEAIEKFVKGDVARSAIVVGIITIICSFLLIILGVSNRIDFMVINVAIGITFYLLGKKIKKFDEPRNNMQILLLLSIGIVIAGLATATAPGLVGFIMIIYLAKGLQFMKQYKEVV